MAENQGKKISDLQARVRQFISHLGMDVSEFEERIGASNGFVSKIGSSMRANSLEKIYNRYPALNNVWLLTGKGNMIKTEGDEDVVMSKVDIIIDENRRLKKENSELKDMVIRLQQLALDKSLSPDKNTVNDK